jgi:hypothetical protein
MPRIRCRYIECVFLEEGYCGTHSIELDPDDGCLTYSRYDDLTDDEEWDEEDLEELLPEDEELYDDEEIDDSWLQDEDSE